MARKIVQTGSSLAVTLPKDIVDRLDLKKGDEVEVSAHPLDGTIVIRPPVRHFANGKVTKELRSKTTDLVKRRAKLYRELAK